MKTTTPPYSLWRCTQVLLMVMAMLFAPRTFATGCWSDGIPPVISGVPADLTVSCGAIPPAPSVCDDVTVGYATSIKYQSGCTDADKALGAPNGTYAQLYDSGDKIQFDFGRDLPAGTEVCLTWRRRNYTATTPDPVNAKAYIWEISGGSYYQTQILTTSNSSSFVTQCFTLSYDCDYVKVKNHGDASDFQIDAIKYTLPDCGPGQIVVSDNCDSSPDVVFNEVTTSCVGGNYTVVRTWTATDNNGNSSSASQTITVIDNIAPVLSGAPADMTVDCGAIPGAETLTAVDGCGGSSVCSVLGYNTGSYRRGLWLPLSGLSQDYTWEGGSAQFEVFEDGTANLTGIAVNKTNTSCKWEVDVWFKGAYDWATWSAMGRTYKPGPGTTGTIYTTWTYYEVDGTRSKLNGLGCFAGDVLNLTNKPSDFSMGLQIGVGANDKDATYGMSFWFYYTGTIYGASASGNGDFNLEGGCTDTEGSGLSYEYWNCSSISSLSSFFASAGTPDKVGVTPNAQDADHLAIRTATDRYVIRWRGAIDIPTSGDYTFYTRSDDGSRLYIDGNLVVNNDGLHAAAEVSGMKNLSAGCHELEIQFFENTGDAIMETKWQGPGIAKAAIPNSVLRTTCGSIGSGVDVPVIFDETVGTCASGSYQIVRTWTATDACGNSASHTQTITVVDDQAPVLSMEPGDITLNCGEPVPPAPDVTATDNCDGSPMVELVELTVAGVLERTWTATDACGNSVSYTQHIGLNPDVSDPVLSGVPSDVTVNCDEIPDVDLVAANDDCDGPLSVNFTETYGPGPNACRQIFRTWTATDAAGNSASATQIITVIDMIAPMLVGVPGNINLDCGEPVPAPPVVTAIDNCDFSVSVMYSESVSGSVITRTWTATDACGNTISASQTIGQNPDTTPPTLIGVPADVTVECGHEPAAAPVTAMDNCDDSVSVDYVEVVDDQPCGRITTRTWTATDAAGNTVSLSQIITSVDTKAPVFSGQPGNWVSYCDNIPPPSTFIKATDECEGLIPLVFTETVAPSVLGCYDLVRVWVATDGCGNSKSWTQLVTVLDTIAPVLSGVPADVELACGEAVPDPAVVTAMDDCSGSVSVNFSEVMSGNLLTRTWTAADGCGNMASAQQEIVIRTNLVISNVSVTAATSCTAKNAVVVIDLDDANAGVPPYTVTINGSVVLGPFASEPIVISNAPGGVTISSIVVNDGGGCEGEDNQIYEIGEPNLEILSLVKTDADCATGMGKVVIDLDDAAAGMPPYRVKIGGTIYGPYPAEPIVVFLAPGTYTGVAVRDNKGCYDQRPGSITINPATGCSPCPPPSGTFEVVNGRHTVDLFWDLVVDATGYIVSIREVGSTVFTEIPVSDITKHIGGLEPCTSYEWCVRSVCGGTISDCSPLRVFTTSCEGAPRTGEVDLLESEVYPNPTRGVINLSITLGKAADLTLAVYDVTGAMIFAENPGTTSSYYTSFDLSGRAPGVYLAKWLVDGESVIEKFVYTGE